MLKDDTLFLKEHLGFWGNLSDYERKIITESVKTVTYSKGQAIYDASRQCPGTLIIKTGQLRTYLLSEDGREITLYRSDPMNILVLSNTCILSPMDFDPLVDAIQDSTALLIPPATFSILMKNIYVENFILRLSASRFSDIMCAVEQILFFSFDRRLARFLIEESNHTGTICMTHEQIAKNIGSAREVVSRMLKFFARQGIVQLKRKDIKIINKQKLLDIV